MLPAPLRAFTFRSPQSTDAPHSAGFHLQPHYRTSRPVDATLLKVEAGSDAFITEKYADEIGKVLGGWSESLLQNSAAADIISRNLASDFQGASPLPRESRVIRSDGLLQIQRNEHSERAELSRDAFARELGSRLRRFSKIIAAEFQITSIDAAGVAALPPQPQSQVRTRVSYEIVGAGGDFHREQWIGNWDMSWHRDSTGDFKLHGWMTLDETQARSAAPVYVDISAAALGGNRSYAAQMQHGADYWRTVLDGACGIDIYGHNGISVADIDNDGFDDLYVCQPAGLPNRLYRNRGDGTFDDVTESSGLGVLDNTACALFADFNNDGRQDVIVVRNSGPLLFLNEGGGKFRLKADAFQFANQPQGSFMSAAVADYDCDGWLDVYFCLYSFYQGAGQYRYPTPYHDAENGPPNFLLRNNRDGTFRDVTAETGLNQNNTRYSFACAWSDYNRDGWPDLCVVNDFGRKNLYRNNGDGTFTDVASQAGVEDVGAGMSVSWLDWRHDGAEGLYVANMWTAAGERVSTQEIFRKSSTKQIRSLYQKHAMGNSLFRSHGADFVNETDSSGTGMGRWSWSSDALDFDHDGFPDLYITNGMVSGPSRQDLNSFFWRQVVACSPDDARASHEYELGWSAINELIRSDGTWSGYERNVFYANNRDGTFSDVSAAVGLDFVEDGRAFALADFDHDGRLELFLKNRNGPQLRVLKNVASELPPSIAFRLRGTKSNRDAIGAVVIVETDSTRQTRMLQAGSGFLSQHSKDLFFGLGDTKGSVRATVRWPSGLVQTFHDLPIHHRVWLEEGSEAKRLEPFRSEAPGRVSPTAEAAADVDRLPETIETWLLAPIAAPEFSLSEASGKVWALSELRGKIVLLNFWTLQSEECLANATALQAASHRWATKSVLIVGIAVDSTFPKGRHFTFPILKASDEVSAVYNILFRQLYDRHRDLTLPTAFLIDGRGNIVKVYQGVLDLNHIEDDFARILQTDPERIARALPFPGAPSPFEFGRNYLSYGTLFFQRGYLDQARAAFEQALRDDPSSAEAMYGIGSVYLNQNENSQARETFERTVKLQAAYPDTLPDAWNNLGVIATRENRVADSLECFEEVLKINPHHLLALDNLSNAYRLLKRWDDAGKTLRLALAVAPDDPEANYGLGMVFAQSGDTSQAYEYLQRALKSRPAYPEALNNLGVLYVVTLRRDLAVASFEECIRVAPGFDQAYLNLARVYALEGTHDKARVVLGDLLKHHPEHKDAKQMLEQLGP